MNLDKKVRNFRGIKAAGILYLAGTIVGAPAIPVILSSCNEIVIPDFPDKITIDKENVGLVTGTITRHNVDKLPYNTLIDLINNSIQKVPVEGMDIGLHSIPSMDDISTRTDISGRYALDNVPAGEIHTIYAKKISGLDIISGYLPGVLVEKQKTTIADFTAFIGNRIIKGRVLSNNNPIEGTTVSFRNNNEGFIYYGPYGQAITDADGNYEVLIRDGITFEVIASKAGYNPVTEFVSEYDSIANIATQDFNLELQ